MRFKRLSKPMNWVKRTVFCAKPDSLMLLNCALVQNQVTPGDVVCSNTSDDCE